MYNIKCAIVDKKNSVYFRDFYVIKHDISFVPNSCNLC